MLQEVLDSANVTTFDIEHIAVTRGPGLKGCLLVGLCFAKSTALALGVPLIPVNHLEGHLFAHELSGKKAEFPFIALLVSGGHTVLVRVESFGCYKVLASTRDDAAGEAFDKSAALLELPYPGGPSLSALAVEGNSSAFKFPIALQQDDTSFSFSGFKTAVSLAVKKAGNLTETVKKDLAASIEQGIVDNLVFKNQASIKKF